MKNSYSYVIIALALCGILLMFDLQTAYGAGFTLVDYGSAQVPDSITRLGTQIFVGSVTSDNVKVFSAIDNSLIATISGVTDPEALYLGSSSDRVYSFDSDGALIELDATNHAVLRSLSHSCIASTGTVANNFLYCSTGAEVIHKISLSSMTVVFSSTTANAGATPCDGIQGLTYDSNSDTMFAGCNTSNRVVAVEGFLTSGTPDFAYAYTGARLLAWNEDNTNILICSSSVARQLVDYTTGAGFTALVTIGDATETCNSTPHLVYHSASNRFIMETAASTETLQFIDGSDGSQLYSQALSGTSNAEQVFAYNNLLVYGARANTDDWFIFDTTGIALGDGGEPDDSQGGSANGVCLNVDANGDGRINVLDCVGENTAWGGFTSGVPAVQVVGSITDGLGLTDCEADGSDQDTCGSGLFFFILTLIILEFLVLAGYLGLTKATNADKQIIDVLLLMLIVGFATVALGFYLDWIPDLVFYSIIALIAGFLTFGIVSKLRGG